jgi:hypothetical protein
VNELPLTLAQPRLLDPVRHDPRPPAVAVLEDWLGQRLPTYCPDPARDWLETWQTGWRVGADDALCSLARREIQEAWEVLTEPARLLRLLRGKRRRGTVGQLWQEHLHEARGAHAEALRLALTWSVPASRVRTWAVGGRYGCASDEVRFRGCTVTVHRRSRVTEDSRQSIGWPSGSETPEGWERDGSYIRRDGGIWRRA